MLLFKGIWSWLCRDEPTDLGYMPLRNPHVRLLIYLGEQRAKADCASMVVRGSLRVVGDRVVEEREQRVEVMNRNRGVLRVYQGGKR